MSYFDKVALLDEDGNPIGVMYPLSTDGDSVYAKDIDTANSSIGDFSGAITDLFDDRTGTITTSTDNPNLYFALKRPISNKEITLVTSSGNYSNVTIVAKDAAGNTLETIDDSSNNTKYTANTYAFTSINKWCHIDITFSTTDDVTLSYICILKHTEVNAHLHALKPDGTMTAIDATTGGNLKVSVEEGDNEGSPVHMYLTDDTNGTIASVEARTQTPSGNALNVQIGPGDPISNIPVVQEFEHHQIHEGETHKAIDPQASLGMGTVKYAFVVPDSFTGEVSEPHLLIEADVYNGSVRIDLYEGATYSGGSSITIYNRNRNSSTTPEATAYTGVTSTDGTLIDSFFAGASIRTAGDGRAGSEWILKNNETYRIDVVGLAAGTQCILSLNWYEDLGV